MAISRIQEHDKIKIARMIGAGLMPIPGGPVGGMIAGKVLDKVPVSDTIKGVARGAIQGPSAILVPPMMGGR